MHLILWYWLLGSHFSSATGGEDDGNLLPGKPQFSLEVERTVAQQQCTDDHQEFLMPCAASITAGVQLTPGLWTPVAPSGQRGIENENVAPGPSFGAAHRRP